MTGALYQALPWLMMGKHLLLYMTPEKGSSYNDLYVCFLKPDGSWTEPKSLGKKIKRTKPG